MRFFLLLLLLYSAALLYLTPSASASRRDAAATTTIEEGDDGSMMEGSLALSAGDEDEEDEEENKKIENVEKVDLNKNYDALYARISFKETKTALVWFSQNVDDRRLLAERSKAEWEQKKRDIVAVNRNYEEKQANHTRLEKDAKEAEREYEENTKTAKNALQAFMAAKKLFDDAGIEYGNAKAAVERFESEKKTAQEKIKELEEIEDKLDADKPDSLPNKKTKLDAEINLYDLKEYDDAEKEYTKADRDLKEADKEFELNFCKTPTAATAQKCQTLTDNRPGLETVRDAKKTEFEKERDDTIIKPIIDEREGKRAELKEIESKIEKYNIMKPNRDKLLERAKAEEALFDDKTKSDKEGIRDKAKEKHEALQPDFLQKRRANNEAQYAIKDGKPAPAKIARKAADEAKIAMDKAMIAKANAEKEVEKFKKKFEYDQDVYTDIQRDRAAMERRLVAAQRERDALFGPSTAKMGIAYAVVLWLFVVPIVALIWSIRLQRWPAGELFDVYPKEDDIEDYWDGTEARFWIDMHKIGTDASPYVPYRRRRHRNFMDPRLLQTLTEFDDEGETYKITKPITTMRDGVDLMQPPGQPPLPKELADHIVERRKIRRAKKRVRPNKKKTQTATAKKKKILQKRVKNQKKKKRTGSKNISDDGPKIPDGANVNEDKTQETVPIFEMKDEEDKTQGTTGTTMEPAAPAQKPIDAAKVEEDATQGDTGVTAPGDEVKNGSVKSEKTQATTGTEFRV